MSGLTQDCHNLLKHIPKGKVTTYKAVAEMLGTKAYRAVGNAVGKNRDIPNVPCHRVVNTSGKLGGYAFGVDKKVDLLRSEGLQIENGKVADFQDNLYLFEDIK